jgi:hypothetical protein
MTIKTQGGKVITKDGKVSCECCALNCYVYPAKALALGEYFESDLPDNVTIQNIVYERSGTTYGTTTNGIRLEGEKWARYSNGVRSERITLIGNGVNDDFPDVVNCAVDYTTPWYEYYDRLCPGSFGETVAGFNVELTREGLCDWLGTYELPISCRTLNMSIRLTYFPGDEFIEESEDSRSWKWLISIADGRSDVTQYIGILGELDNLADQKTILGSYNYYDPNNEQIILPTGFPDASEQASVTVTLPLP